MIVRKASMPGMPRQAMRMTARSSLAVQETPSSPPVAALACLTNPSSLCHPIETITVMSGSG